MTAATKTHQYIPNLMAISPRTSSVLDLSRWVAAFLVLIYHLFENILVARPDVSASHLTFLVKAIYLIGDCGHQAVTWFFVVSGFLVGGSVLSDIRRNRFKFSTYSINRVSRLYTVLLPALVIGYCLDHSRLFLHGMSPFPGAGGESPASYTPWAFLANALCLQTILSTTLGSNNPLWSLAWEAWYYVLFPLLLAPLMLPRKRLARAALFVLGLIILGFLLHYNPRLVRGFPIWLLGASIRLCSRPVIRSQMLSWLIALLATITFPLMLVRFGAISSLIVGAGYANVLLTIVHSKNQAALSGCRIHTALSGFSYSLYLTHAPLLHFLLTMANRSADPRLNLQPSGWLPLARGVLYFSIVIFYAWLFSRLTETHTDSVRAALGRFWRRPSPVPKTLVPA